MGPIASSTFPGTEHLCFPGSDSFSSQAAWVLPAAASAQLHIRSGTLLSPAWRVYPSCWALWDARPCAMDLSHSSSFVIISTHHPTDEKTAAQRAQVTCLRPHSFQGANMTVFSSLWILFSKLEWYFFFPFQNSGWDSSGISHAEFQHWVWILKYPQICALNWTDDYLGLRPLMLPLALLFQFGSQHGVLVLSALSRIIEKVLICQDICLLGFYRTGGEGESYIYTST